MKAVDNDKGHNGQVRYSIVQQPNQKGTKFIVDEITGDIRTNKVSINCIKREQTTTTTKLFRVYFILLLLNR